MRGRYQAVRLPEAMHFIILDCAGARYGPTSWLNRPQLVLVAPRPVGWLVRMGSSGATLRSLT